MNTHDLIVILNYISLAVMAGCTVSLATHEPSRLQKLALLVCVSLTVCCLGFLIRTEATTAEGLIIGQKLIYAFVTHGMYLMLLFITDYCRFTVPDFLRGTFHTLNFLMSFGVLLLDHHGLFYLDYWAVEQNGYFVLEKEYGPLHSIAVALFGFYMAATVVVTVIFSVRNYQRRRYVLQLASAVALPCLSYLIPKLFDWETDLQPFAFAAFTVLVLLMIYRNRLYDVDNIASIFSIQSMTDALIVFDTHNHYRGSNELAQVLFPALRSVTLDSDIDDALPELNSYLSGEKKEYICGEKIYDVALHPVGDDGEQEGAVLWFRDVTLERKYTNLLRAQVDTLFAYSYMDELTALRNRRSYEEELDELRAAPDICDLTVVALDLNGLKATNDAMGHSAGDTLLKGAAEVLKSVFGSEGDIFRIGGDEFFVILRNCKESISELTERLTATMNAWDGLPGKKLSLASGFAKAENGELLTVDELLSRADQAMYDFKRHYYEESGMDRRRR